MKKFILIEFILSANLVFALFGCTQATIDYPTLDSNNSDTTWIELQSNPIKKVSTKTEVLTKIYTQAINDYIKLVNKEYKLRFDTLYFGKHVNNSETDFPDIELPGKINNTQIRLITPEQGEKNKNDRKSSCYINLIGTVNEEVAEFIFVTFSNDFVHQFDCFENYKIDSLKKQYTLDNYRFEKFHSFSNEEF